jgi:sulfur oxidation c-type cytochrome SoxX
VSGWQEKYKKLYKEAKERGVSFFPHAVAKDAFMALLILCLLSFLAIHYGAGLEDVADPTDTTYNPRPEWYFLFMFQALKAFPGNLEPVAAVILPGIVVGLLFLLPFLDRGPKRHPFDRPLITGLGVFGLMMVSYLTYAGAKAPLLNPVVEKDAAVETGRRLYSELNCAYCHKIGAKGGAVGPRLDTLAPHESVDWLERHFRDPKSVTPGSQMPQMNLLDDEVKSLAAYMKSLGGGEPYSPEAPKIFEENCSACHRIGKKGGDTGPDLSLIGSARDTAYIRRYVNDPSLVNPSSAMPGFKGQLTDTQIEDVARYLSSLGR